MAKVIDSTASSEKTFQYSGEVTVNGMPGTLVGIITIADQKVADVANKFGTKVNIFIMGENGLAIPEEGSTATALRMNVVAVDARWVKDEIVPESGQGAVLILSQDSDVASKVKTGTGCAVSDVAIVFRGEVAGVLQNAPKLGGALTLVIELSPADVPEEVEHPADEIVEETSVAGETDVENEVVESHDIGVQTLEAADGQQVNGPTVELSDVEGAVELKADDTLPID